MLFFQEFGTPVLTATSTCSYTFNWESSVAAAINSQSAQSQIRTDCKAINPLTGYLFDLTPLQKKGEFKVDAENGKHFIVSACGALQNSNGK